MASKPKKTTAELTTLIMEEIRKYPECDNITALELRDHCSPHLTTQIGHQLDLALQKDAPLHRAVQRSGVIIAIPILAGLHHQYVRI